MSAALAYWAGHALAAIVAAALVAVVAQALHRALALSHAAHDYWLGAWALAALPAPVALLLERVAAPDLVAALPSLPPLAPWSMGVAGTDAAPSSSHALDTPSLLAALYVAGVAWHAWRASRARRALQRLFVTATPLAPDALGPRARREATALRRRGVRLLTAADATTPFLCGWRAPRLVLPAALLARLDDASLALVLRHEAAHLARHDVLRAALLRVGHAVLWFNPVLPRLARRAQLAAELACDARALQGEGNMRRAYAEAYLETLRMSATRTLAGPLVAFSPQDFRSHRMRIEHIVHGDPRARKRPALAVALACTALVAGSALAAAQTAPLATGDPVAFAGPIVDGRVSSPFGVSRPQLAAHPHRGIDLSAPRGTPVHAPAAGVVTIATTDYAPNPDYGTVVMLDHGGGWQSVYAHLDSLAVAAGERVAAGQRLGGLGRTGKATGPHVHVELLRDGERVDPAAHIASPVGAR